MASTAKSWLSTLKRYIKAPWSYTGPVSSPEYKSAVPLATEYRLYCPATIRDKPAIPTSDPETVFDIKYYTRDPIYNRRPVRRFTITKPDANAMLHEAAYAHADRDEKPFLPPRLVKERFDIVGDGYEDGLPKEVDVTRYKVV